MQIAVELTVINMNAVALLLNPILTHPEGCKFLGTNLEGVMR